MPIQIKWAKVIVFFEGIDGLEGRRCGGIVV